MFVSVLDLSSFESRCKFGIFGKEGFLCRSYDVSVSVDVFLGIEFSKKFFGGDVAFFGNPLIIRVCHAVWVK